MPSDPQKPAVVDESRLKTILVVIVTLAALVFLVARPLLIDGENEAGQKDGKQVENSELANKESAENSAETKDEGESVAGDSEAKTTTGTAGTKSKGPESKTGQAGEKSTTHKKSVRSNSSDGKKNKSAAGDRKTRGPPVTQKSGSENSSLLTRLSNDRYRSAAGLIYGPGSRDGHRLTHVMKHAKDDLSKPIHGVFDGERDEILRLIDQAYERIQKKHSSVVQTESGKRTVYSVYFGKRIGYVGGQTGERKNKPLAKTLVLVLEDNRVITAYPK